MHELVAKRSTFNNTLDKCSWRLDVATHSKGEGSQGAAAAVPDAEPSEENASAIVEISLRAPVGESKVKGSRAGGTHSVGGSVGGGVESVRFELSKAELKGILADVQAIQDTLVRHR